MRTRRGKIRPTSLAKDIHTYDATPKGAIGQVRNWLITASRRQRLPGGAEIHDRYPSFKRGLAKICAELKRQPEELTFGDYSDSFTAPRLVFDRARISLYHNSSTVDPKFFKLNPASGIPIYVQLMDRIKHAVESCVLIPGDQLPGIRTLAQQLVVSPNTVVKAYTELDREGVIELRHGSGAFVVDRDRCRDRSKEVRIAQSIARDLIDRLRRHGFSDGEIRRFVEAELNLEPVESHR